jgi:hypothetical protein
VQHERTSRIFSFKTHEPCRFHPVIGGDIRVATAISMSVEGGKSSIGAEFPRREIHA